ncbi:type I glutamate--ammonia ligase [Candidatus Acetothermia bacterium]|nr:MAG: type I glutamate--ammonia ligase [Candidatus Acetothermia bacterium]
MVTSEADNENIFRQLEERKVLFINILFTDTLGELKSVEIPVMQFKGALSTGISFDGSSIRGYADIANADMYLKPDLATLKIYPWPTLMEPHEGKYRTAGVIADPYTTDGTPSIHSPRYILQRFLQGVAKRGFRFFVGVEPEFFLFPQGKIPTSRSEVISKSGYFALVPDDAEEAVRKEIVASLIKMGIPIEKSHHEIEPYINELSFEYADPVTTADRLMIVKFVAKSIAAQHGFKAVFMPKPIARFAACGMHTHISLFRDGKNAFSDPQDALGLSQHARFFIGGLIEHIRAVTALTNPTINSYKRLIPGFEAPVNIAWGRKNRSTLIRIPATPNPNATRLELRSPDPSANPYLAFTAILAAGMDGIERSIEPPAAVEESIYLMSEEEKAQRGIEPLPSSLEQTIAALESDRVISSALGAETTEYIIHAKREEITSFNQSVTDWERQQYLDV